MPRELDVLLPEILQYAPSCPDPLAFKRIREVARKACERGLFWRCTDEIIFSDGAAEGLCTVVDASIVKIDAAEIDGQPLKPVTIAWLDEKYPLWDKDTRVDGAARYITQVQPNSVSLYPRTIGTVTARFILKPSRRATTLPDFMIEQYYEILGRGAAAEVLMTPNEKVRNFELGAALRMDFEAWLNELNIKAAKGQQGARLRTRGQYL